MSVGPYFARWSRAVDARFRWFRWEGDYMATAIAPWQWHPVSYRYTLFGVPLTWWRRVGGGEKNEGQ